MRVLWASQVIPYPPKSGVHLRSYHLLRGVAARYDVDLVAFIQEPWLKIFYHSRDEALEDCGRHLREWCRSVRFLSIDSFARPLGKVRTALEGLVSPPSYTIRWLQSRGAHAAFADYARRSQYHLAHFDTVSLAPYRPLFGNTPATLGHHNVESHMLQRRSEKEPNWLKRWYFRQESSRVRRYEARVADSFAAHIACSELDCSRLRELAPGINAVAIPNGVDVEFFHPIPGVAAKPSLVFVGSLNWYPNVDAVSFLLRDIWPLVKARVPDLRLDIVGSAPPAAILQLAAPLADVTVHGFVDDVRPFIQAAQVYVCPIRDGGGTKLKVLDAFAMGKCVVAHPIACEGIDVTPGKNVLLADSAQACAEAIQNALDNNALRERIGDAARQLVVERYSFAQIATRLCDVFAAAAAAPSDLRAAVNRPITMYT